MHHTYQILSETMEWDTLWYGFWCHHCSKDCGVKHDVFSCFRTTPTVWFGGMWLDLGAPQHPHKQTILYKKVDIAQVFLVRCTVVTLMKSALGFHATTYNEFHVTRNEKGPFEETCCLSGQLCSQQTAVIPHRETESWNWKATQDNTARIRSGDQLAVVFLHFIWLGLAIDLHHGHAEQAQG